MDRDRDLPGVCPLCHSPRVGPVQDPDLAEVPGAPTTVTPYPGVLACRDCGTIVRWEP